MDSYPPGRAIKQRKSALDPLLMIVKKETSLCLCPTGFVADSAARGKQGQPGDNKERKSPSHQPQQIKNGANIKIANLLPIRSANANRTRYTCAFCTQQIKSEA